MSLIADLTTLLGATNVLTGPDMARYAQDWMGNYHGSPIAVARPGSTAEVAETVRLAAAYEIPVIPISGNTGLTGGTFTEGGLLLSTGLNSIGWPSQVISIRAASSASNSVPKPLFNVSSIRGPLANDDSGLVSFFAEADLR